jgi:catechol 2,3-dioxygenase-like lactoylglutathione lyase family enzyme
MRNVLVLAAAVMLVASSAYTAGQQESSGAGLPMPALHHIHLNSVNPEASLAWYRQYWPKGQTTTFAGYPAFHDEIYLLYTKVAKQAPGGFDRRAGVRCHRAFSGRLDRASPGRTPTPPASGSKLDRRQFAYLQLYGGADGKQTALHALDLPMGDALLTRTAMRERAEKEKAAPRPSPTAALDFFYFVDPDGMLVEVTAGKSDSFWNHTHMWHEQPLCAANWYAENLGFQIR